MSARPGGWILAVLCLSLIPARGRAMGVEFHPEYAVWWVPGTPGNDRTEQFYAPLDLRLAASPSVRVLGGAELAWARARGGGYAYSRWIPGEAHLGLEASLLRDRVRLSAFGRSSMVLKGLTEEEVDLARVLQTTALEFPLPRYADGNRFAVQAAGRILRRSRALVQAGVGYEARGSYEVAADGARVEPGSVFRAAASAQVAGTSWRQELRLRRDHPAESRFDTGSRYREGDLTSFAYALLWNGAGAGEAGASGGIAVRSAGTITSGAPLDARAVGAGSVFWWRLSAGSSLGRVALSVSLGETGIRSFPGPLGGATWLDPGLAARIPFSAGILRGGLRLPVGRVRGGGRMHGVGLDLSWSGELR